MLTENGIMIDQEAVNELLEKADVLTIGFTLFPQRLLMDVRSTVDGSVGPLVTLVDPVANVQERYLWLGRHRGMFGAPQGFSFFVWPHTLRYLLESDALRLMRQRLEALPGNGAEQLNTALELLIRLENDEHRRAVLGADHYHTFWQRSPV